MRKGTKQEQEQRDRYTKLRSMLRRAWVRDPERYAVLNDASTKRVHNGDNKRQKYEHQCKFCLGWFKAKEITVDHILPCGTFLNENDWFTFGPNLFCSRTNLQKLCKTCHKIKSAEERKKHNEN